MFIIIIFITITQQPEQDRWAENQPTAGLSSLNEYENGMGKSETELLNNLDPDTYIWEAKYSEPQLINKPNKIK